MSFSEVLNRYIDQIGCTGAELAKQSGIPASTFSRYRSGFRVPSEDSEMLDSIAEGILRMMHTGKVRGQISEEESTAVTKASIKEDLIQGLHGEDSYVNQDKLGEKMDSLIKALKISPSQLALFLRLDLSSLYRIRKGTRKTRTPEWITHSLAVYISKHRHSASDREILEELTGRSLRYADSDEYSKAIEEWLSGKGEDLDTISATLLGSIDTVDIQSMMRYQVRGFRAHPTGTSKDGASFVGSIIPKRPQRPIHKSYSGPIGFAEGVTDFLKKAAQDTAVWKGEIPDFPGKERLEEVAGDDVIVYSEFPAVDIRGAEALGQQIITFGNKIIQSGRKIHMIYAKAGDWPKRWMMMKYLIPLFLTGDLRVYFVEGETKGPLQRVILCSASCFFYAEMIDRDFNTVHASFLQGTPENKYLPLRSRRLLACAEKVGEVYPKERMPAFFEVARQRVLFDKAKDRHYTVLTTVPPLWTIREDLLDRILKSNHVSQEIARKVRLYRELDRFYYGKMIEHGGLWQGIGLLSETEFAKYPLSLSLSNVYMEEAIVYTYEQYLAHWEQTREMGKCTEGYQVFEINDPIFRNIRLVHQHGEDGMQLLSRNSVPCFHLLISHPELLKIGEEIMKGMIGE